MIRTSDKIWRGSMAVLAALCVAWSAAPIRAETLVFHNDCKSPIVVQVVSVSHGVFRRDRPYLLRHGEATTPGIALPGDKVITVSDAKLPNRVLFQGAMPAGSLDRHYSILPDAPSPRVRLRMLPPSRR